MLSKIKMDQSLFSDEAIVDIKKVLESKGKIYKTPEDLIHELHKDMADRQKTALQQTV